MTGTPVISVMEWNGDSAKTDKTSNTVRFKSADDAVANTSNPIVIPGAGQVYSFEKWLRLRIGSGDPAQQLANLKFYSDGTNSFGGNVFLFGHQSADFTYTFRSACAPSTNNNPPHGGSGSLTMTSVMFYTAAGGYSLSSAAETFSGTSTDIGRFVVLVLRVIPGATPGTLPAETLSFSYDTSAAAVTSNQNVTLSLGSLLNKTITASLSLNAVQGKAVDDSLQGGVAGVEMRIPAIELLYNDFTPITPTGFDAPSSTVTYIESIVSATNSSATLSEGVVSVFSSGAGAVSVYYVANFLSAVSTGSIALTATEFADEALIFNLATLHESNVITENRSGTLRATGLDYNGQIVAYASGEQRYHAELDSQLAWGLVVEDTGKQSLTNANWSGGATTPTSWNAPTDGTRSVTASLLGDADGAVAFLLTGPRPFMWDTYVFTSSVTYTNSVVVEAFSGASTNAIMAVINLSSVVGTATVNADVLSSYPQYITQTFYNGGPTDQTAQLRYGHGISGTRVASITLSRPMLESHKSARSTYQPDGGRAPDRPTVTVGANFPFSTAQGSFVIQARTPPYLGTQVLFQLDNGTAGDKHFVYRDISSNLHYVITQAGTDRCDLIYSAVASDTAFRLAIDYSASGVFTLLNSASVALTDASVVLPTVTTLRLGHDISGNHWNGTIAEFNVYRTCKGVSGVPTLATPASQIPYAFYGPGVMASSVDGTQLNATGKQVSYRFKATQSGTATSVRWYNGWDLVRSGWNRYSGTNTMGPGGITRLRFFQNDPNAGAGGTGAHVPSFASQVGSTVLFSAHDVYTASSTITNRFPTVSVSAVFSASGIYHLVFDNTITDPSDNFTTILGLNQSWAPTPHTPAQPDLYGEVLERLTGVNTWTREPRVPILQIGYADGSVQGQGYMDVNVDAIDSGWLNVGGATQIRQIFMPDETFTAEQFWLGGYTESANTTIVCTVRQQSNGFVKDTMSIAATMLGTSRYSWLTANTSSGVTYSASVTYHWTLTSTSGNYRFKTLRDGAGTYGLNSRLTVKGHAQVSTDSGSAFNGVTIDQTTGSTEGDFEFFFVRS